MLNGRSVHWNFLFLTLFFSVIISGFFCGCRNHSISYKGNIEGTILDSSTRKPIKNALVFCHTHNISIETIWDWGFDPSNPPVLSNDNGEYLLRNLYGKERCYLTISEYTGYRISQYTVEIIPNSTVTLEHLLTPVDIDFEVKPDSIFFASGETESNFTISNNGSDPLMWKYFTRADWITTNDVTGRVSPGGTQEISCEIARSTINSYNFGEDSTARATLFLGIFETGELREIDVIVKQ